MGWFWRWRGEKDIEAGIAWLTSKGIRVDPVTDDVMEEN